MMQTIRRNRQGFTLVELLVVIAIIGMLIALLLPAIQAARESARRAQCINQMKQLALAALNFETSYKRLPGGTGYDKGQDTSPNPPNFYHGQGWIVEVLPFVEEQVLSDVFAKYRNRNFTSNPAQLGTEMLDAIKQQPVNLVCPSDGAGRELITTQKQWEHVSVAPTNYRGVMGSNQMVEGTNSFPIVQPLQAYCNDGRIRCNGLIWRTSSQYPVKLKQVTDGVSKTMMVGEDLASHDWHTMWSFSNGDSSSTYASLNYSLNHPDPAAWWDMRGFRSYHPGGANFAFGDGRVEFIQEDIEFDLYKEMSTASNIVRSTGVLGGRP